MEDCSKKILLVRARFFDIDKLRQRDNISSKRWLVKFFDKLLGKLYIKLYKIDLEKLDLSRCMFYNCSKNMKIANKNYEILAKEVEKIANDYNMPQTYLNYLEEVYYNKANLTNLAKAVTKDDKFANLISEVDFILKMHTYYFMYADNIDADIQRLKLISRLNFLRELIIFQTALTFYSQEHNFMYWDKNRFIVRNETKNKELMNFVCEYITTFNILINKLLKKDYKAMRETMNKYDVEAMLRKGCDVFAEFNS